MTIILYPKFPFLRIPGLQVSIRLEDFLMAAVVGICGIYLLPRLLRVFSLNIEKTILIYLVVGLLSLLSAIFITKTAGIEVGFLHWLRRIEYFAGFFLGVLASRKRENLGFYIKILLLTLFIVFLYAAGQRYFYWPVIVTQNVEYAKGIALRWIPGSHINSTFAGHYDLATFLVLVLPIFISLFYVIKKIKTRIILGIAISCGLWLLLVSVSRISIASYLLASSVALLWLRKYKAILVVIGVSLIFFSFSSDLRTRYVRIFDEARKRLGEVTFYIHAQEDLPERRTNVVTPMPTPMPVLEDRSSSIRLNVEWPRAIRAFSKNPLLGTGYSSITLATDNDYLRALGETGILGLVAFSLIFIRISEILLTKYSLIKKEFSDIDKSFVAGMMGGSLGILVNALFVDVFEASKFAIIFWILIGILVGFIRKKNYAE
ncbi:hypothetical protein A2V56_03480 [Candidatus Woesebacteria bacterium RBG_19FT_COMBO_42_9]|uniref:O-antigen ligase-related domain-containing protein n=1 Tax=Candidatus Woesebacteria bacterium RBG_16_42_24 TaxID=1802485 RepID=A0A1F7XKI4_9BACT|nr:MAG: hypothetical protein A2V97_00760 [Candidatus Woesebacteria bacterium RBG_16_42_24]OGM16117.1 MAG: hypothetical protein A2V56_03480 [Candidatus Woesebacteria bacterium RBG_19FT_COMBO_42_9]